MKAAEWGSRLILAEYLTEAAVIGWVNEVVS